MSEVKNMPALRFSEFSEGWNFIHLSELMIFKNGINASKEQYGSGKKFINVLDIIENDSITHDKITGSVDISDEEFEKNSVSYGDILFQRSSETRAEVGQSNVYLDTELPATFGGFVIRGKKVGDYYPSFMNLALKTSFVRKEITSRSGGSTRYNIGQESLSKVQVCLPVINEQQKIADFLSLVDKKIEQLTEKHRLLTDYKKGVMQQIFSQQIRFKDENGNDYPEWEKKKITEIAKTSIGLVTSMTPYYVDCGVPLIRNNDIFQNRIRKEGLIQLDYDFDILNKHRRLKRYDIVTVHTGEIGVSAVIDEMLDGAQGFATLNTRVKELSKTCPFFLSWYYNSSENIKYALSMATGDGRSNYNLKDFNKAIIPYPSFEEQQKIANFLTEIDQKIDQAWSTLEQTKAFKKGLLQQMFV